MPDVRMPDGTIIRNVPENATREQILAAYNRAHSAGAVNPQRKEAPRPPQNNSAWDGFVAGLAKTVDAPFRWLDSVNPYAQQKQLPTETPAAYQARLAEVNKSNQSRTRNQAMLENNTRTGWQTAGKIAGTIPATLLTKNPWLGGALGGAQASDSDNVSGVANDAFFGALGGKAGQLAGKYVVAPVAAKTIAPAVRKLAQTAGGQKATTALKKLMPQIDVIPAKQAPVDRGLNRVAPDMAQLRANLQDAQRLGLPYSLADASPKTRMLAGSVSRKSADARQLAEDTFGPRALGQAERATEAIDTRLAPITNIEQRSAAIKKNAQDASKPFYDAALSQRAPVDEELQALLKTPAGSDALAEARKIALNEQRSADEIEYLMREAAGESPIAPQDGRFTRAVVGDPAKQQLSRGNVSGRNGPVPKVGPLDLVGWVRSNGGLMDQGNELSHMGLTNAPRRGMDFIGREAQFGPLVNPNGMNLDDAAHNAWEAGYFPHLSERPDTNTFLDALRGTHEGWNRHFLPEDMPEVYNYGAALEQKHLAQQARATGKLTGFDTSEPAGFDIPTAPLSAYAPPEVVKTPKFETLQLVKRGLDTVLEKNRDATSGKLVLDGRPDLQAVDKVRARLNAKLGELNPSYSTANGVYGDYMAQADALRLGHDLIPKTSTYPRNVQTILDRISKKDASPGAVSGLPRPEAMPDLQSGFATSLADSIGNVNEGANPWTRVYGSPHKQAKVGMVFPEGAHDFNRIYGLEGDMSKTAYETIGGSPTQARNMADQMFDGGGVSGLLSSVSSPKTAITKAVLQKFSDQLRTRGEKNAAKMAPVLFDTDPSIALKYIDMLSRNKAEREAQRAAYARLVGRIGGPAAIGFLSGQ